MTLCWGAAAPLPVTDSLTGDPDALVANDTVADAAPLACGVKVRVNAAVLPAGIVSGNLGPVSANSAVLTVAEVTVTLEDVALRVAVRLLLDPTVTLPKLKLPGATANWPAAVPVPDSETEGVAPVASDTSAMLPVAGPVVVGVKVTLNVKLCPAAIANGKGSPLMVNPLALPVRVACEMFTVAPPEFVRIAFCVPVSPTCTLPKLTALAAKAPGATPVPERGMVTVGVDPLLVMARFTLLLPAD